MLGQNVTETEMAKLWKGESNDESSEYCGEITNEKGEKNATLGNYTRKKWGNVRVDKTCEYCREITNE